MLVSHHHKFIYFKTIKTASTSVESFFEPFCLANQDDWRPDVFNQGSDTEHGIVGYRGVRQRHWGIFRRKWYDHMPAKLVKRQLSSQVWNSYFKFCVIRNPFDKAVSAFHFHQWMEQRRLSRMSVPKSDSEISRFRRWVAVDVGKRYLLLDRPCYVVKGSLITDFEIRFENLQDDLEKVCRRLGIDRNLAELPRFNTGVRRPAPIQEFYDQATRKTIERVFDFELNHFGYDFPN